VYDFEKGWRVVMQIQTGRAAYLKTSFWLLEKIRHRFESRYVCLKGRNVAVEDLEVG
jgi:hypothetical protein